MSETPIFAAIFKTPWQELPLVFQKHYAVRAYKQDRVIAKGRMNIQRGPLARILSPLFALVGALVPYDGTNVAVTVTFYSGLESNQFHFDRLFYIPGQKAFRFHSRIEHISGDEVIELMRFGIGWRARYRHEGNRITLTHAGYALKFRDRLIDLPLTWLLGRGAAAEEVIGPNSFSMWMSITHPVFGKICRYSGKFQITEVSYA